ncbi:MAG: DNA-3-methyladenine glycosylase 2 family protein [Rubrobacter sp.]|nr:DNA-3-methyladenine glycosylase 2 family protein [Rubrobacter sp.]
MVVETVGRTGRFELTPVGPYSISASARFLEGFAPAHYEGSGPEHLRFAFAADGLDRGERVAGAYVYSEGEKVVVETYGEATPKVVRDQVERVLSLDVDGSGFPEIGRRDPIVGRLQDRYPGLRPVCFYSPYEAAAWAIIGNRVRIVQAARVKARMAEELGSPVEVRGKEERAFPGPSTLVGLDGFPGLSGRKAEYLRALARAALEGYLEAPYLRSLPTEEALVKLKELPGIGDFSAELVLLRGVGVPDRLPTHEPRLGRAVAMAYGLKESPTAEDLFEISEGWRPYRSWVGLHLRTMLEDETGEISGKPKSPRSRAATA